MPHQYVIIYLIIGLCLYLLMNIAVSSMLEDHEISKSLRDYCELWLSMRIEPMVIVMVVFFWFFLPFLSAGRRGGK